MIVSGTNRRVSELQICRESATERDGLLVEETNGIDGHHTNAGNAVIQHERDGPEIVMDPTGSAALVKAGNPNGMFRVVECGRDFHAAKAGTERQCRRGGLATID